MNTLVGTLLQARYDDGRVVTFEPCANHEIAVRIDDGEPLFFDALDLLRAVSTVTLDHVYGASPTDERPTDPLAAAALDHQQRGRQDGTWGCACGWIQDKPHREHVADMAAAATTHPETGA